MAGMNLTLLNYLRQEGPYENHDESRARSLAVIFIC